MGQTRVSKECCVAVVEHEGRLNLQSCHHKDAAAAMRWIKNNADEGKVYRVVWMVGEPIEVEVIKKRVIKDVEGQRVMEGVE